MKKYIFSFVFLCLMVLAGAASVQAQTILPGNNFQTAVVFPMNSTQPGQITTKGVENWYRFEAVAGASYLIQTQAVGLKGEARIQLLDSDGKTTLGYAEPGGSKKKNDWRGKTYFSGLSGPKYVKVTASSFGTDSAYSFRILDGSGVAGSGDDFEPDGLPINAKVLPLNTEQAHNFHAGKDEDWVKFETTPCAHYYIQTKAVGPAGNVRIQLMESDGVKTIGYAENGGSSKNSQWAGKSYFTGVGGTRYVKITSSSSGPSATYLVRVLDGRGQAGGGDDYEYDGCKLNAKPIAVSTEQTHNMHASKDEDWLSFESVAGGSYKIETKAVGPAGNVRIQLMESDGVKGIGYAENGGSTKDHDSAGGYAWKGKTYVLKTGGTKYVKLTNSNFGPSSTYQVRVALPNAPTAPVSPNPVAPTNPTTPTVPATTFSKTWQPITTGGQNNDGKYWGPAYCNNHAGAVRWPEHPTSTYTGPKIEKCYSKNGKAVGKMMQEMTEADRNLTGQDCSAYPTGLEIKTKVEIGSNYRCTAQPQSAKRGMMAATLEAVRALFRTLTGSRGE